MCCIKLALCLTQLGVQSIMHSDFQWSGKDDYHTSWSQKRSGSMQINGKSLQQYIIVWAVTEMLHHWVQNPDIKIHSLSLIIGLRHLRGAGIC